MAERIRLGNANEFPQVIEDMLIGFIDESMVEIDHLFEEEAGIIVDKLRTRSRKRTGRYAKGWKKKRQPNGVFLIHNPTHYQLAHLLEKGWYRPEDGAHALGDGIIAATFAESEENLKQKLKQYGKLEE